jgi:predicted TPR repeat methyltransferase
MTITVATALNEHRIGNYAKARDIYHQILSREPLNCEALHLLAILEAQQNNLETAAALLKHAISIDKKNSSLYNSIGNVFKNQDKLKEASKAYEKALDLDPKSTAAHNNLAIVLNKLGDKESAEKHYRLALALQPGYTEAHYNLGLLLGQNEVTITEAIEHFLTIIKLDPEHAASAHEQVAQIFFKQNQIDTAIEHYQKAIALDKHNLEVHKNLGALLAQKGELVEATYHLRKVLAADSKNTEALSNLGAIFIQEKNLEEALKCYLSVINLAPSFEAYYNLGIIYLEQNHALDALPYFQEALQFKPDDFATHNNLGAIYLRMEDYPKAIASYKMALQAKPEDQEIQYLLAALQQDPGSTANDIIIPKAAPKDYLAHLFDQYAPYFDQHLTKFLGYKVPELLFAAVLKILAQPESELAASLVILDLGCGTGLSGLHWRKLAKTLVGVDISAKMLQVAQEKNIYDELKLSELTATLASYHQALDLIIAADTLVYLGDLNEVFKNVKEALKPSGLFAFTIENTDSYPYILQKNARFAHAQSYIEELSQKYSFRLENSEQITLRQQKEAPVSGSLYVLKPI